MSVAKLHTVSAKLTEVFDREGFTVAGVSSHLGAAGTAAWRRGEPAAVRRQCTDGSTLGLLIRTFIVGDWVDENELEEVIGADCLAELPTERSERGVRVMADCLPHVLGGKDRWVFSDRDASMLNIIPGSDHVLGVGAASLSLAATVPTTEVDSLLDLGTGSGVQILSQLDCVKHAIGTDIHQRALDYAGATFAGAGASNVELIQGGWFEPVAGRTFDRIVANPPFVVGLPEVGHVYRDSGLNLDGASELVISQTPAHLNPGGTAHLLAAWAHCEGERWQQRVASWLPDTGVAAWVLQRDVADPELYVGTWLRDESIDPRSDEGQARTDAWLEHFERNHVNGIGFGFVAIQRIADDAPSDIVIEEFSHDFQDNLGEEFEEYFLRTGWLREQGIAELAQMRYALRPTIAMETVAVLDTDNGIGMKNAVVRISRMDGPRFSHEIDEHVAAMLSGLSAQGLPLYEVVSLYSAAHDLDEDAVLTAMIGIVVDLVRHGLVLPAELISD